MGNKCCGPSALNCDIDHTEYSQGGIIRKPGKGIRQSSSKYSRDIEGMKRQIDETGATNVSLSTVNLSRNNIKVVDTGEDATMSFLKGAEREGRNTNDFQLQKAQDMQENTNLDYDEWEQMTVRMEENFEITTEARDYNNAEFDDTKSEIQLEEGPDPDGRSRDAYQDPYEKVDGGMASTESFTLWKTLMPVFAEMSRLDYFKAEIRAGRKQYKDFYVYFRQNLLKKFDDCVCEK